MTFLTERLAELRKHLDHLHGLRPRVENPRSLEQFVRIVAGMEAE